METLKYCSEFDIPETTESLWEEAAFIESLRIWLRPPHYSCDQQPQF